MWTETGDASGYPPVWEVVAADELSVRLAISAAPSRSVLTDRFYVDFVFEDHPLCCSTPDSRMLVRLCVDEGCGWSEIEEWLAETGGGMPGPGYKAGLRRPAGWLRPREAQRARARLSAPRRSRESVGAARAAAQMGAMREAGWTLDEVAHVFDRTRERVRQITNNPRSTIDAWGTDHAGTVAVPERT